MVVALPCVEVDTFGRPALPQSLLLPPPAEAPLKLPQLPRDLLIPGVKLVAAGLNPVTEGSATKEQLLSITPTLPGTQYPPAYPPPFI